MRTTFALIGATAMLAALGYHFVKAEERPKPRHVATLPATASEEKSAQSSVVAKLLRATPSDTDARQTDVNDKLSELEARLRSMESAGEKTENANPSDEGKRKSDPKVSEAELASWMDEALRTEAWDRDWTNQTTAEIEKGLAQLPEIKLEELDCNKRVCRASFAQDNGQRPPAPSLFGLVPFAPEGFTIEEPDGRVKVYFTRAGESLKDLRTEAVASLH